MSFKMTEIAYSINSQATLDQGCLVLDLLHSFKEGSFYRLEVPPKPLLIPEWRALAASKTVDKEAFTFLLKEELLFQQQASGRTPHVDSFLLKQMHIAPARVLSALQ